MDAIGAIHHIPVITELMLNPFLLVVNALVRPPPGGWPKPILPKVYNPATCRTIGMRSAKIKPPITGIFSLTLPAEAC
jgi:hypothetical protein